jgi:Ca2+-binding RTX toxin-like protein
MLVASPSLIDIFRGPLANGFRRLAQWRKAGVLGERLQAQRRSRMRFEPLEQRLLLSADLNPVIDDFLNTLDNTVAQAPIIAFDYIDDDGVITIGKGVDDVGADIALRNVRLSFNDLTYDSANQRWNGQVGVEAKSAELFPDSLGIAVTDRDTDPDLFAAAGVFDLARGTPATLNLDDLDAEALGWPAFLDIEFTALSLDFENFRVDNNLNSLHLEVEFTGLDTGNEALNELLAADNPLFGLKVEGAAAVTLAIKEIEDTIEASNASDVVAALSNGLAAAMGSGLDTLAGSISGKLFAVGSIDAGFIFRKVTVDPDQAGPLLERSATYLAVEGGFSIADEDFGGRGPKFDIAFAVSNLGPLQFFVSGGPIKRFEPTTGLTIEEVRLGVRFNATIEDLQTETDFHATGATVDGTRVTLTVPLHDLAIGDDFRIRNADNGNYNGDFTVFSINGNEVTYDVVADPGAFVGDAEIIRLTITDPLDLRDAGLESGIAPPESMSVWRAQLDAAVANQIEAGDNIWDRLFGEVVFGGGGTLSIDPIPDTVMQLDVDFMLDTDLRILLAGNLSFLDGLVSIPASLYADLSDLFSGSGRFLFLADIPEVPVIDPLLVLRGEAFFEALGAANLLDALVTADGGFWEIDLELGLDNPSEEYIIGDRAVIYGSELSAFDGTYDVIGIDDATNTITVLSNTNPGMWVAGDVRKIANENSLHGGLRLGIAGGIDLNIPLVTTLTLEGQAQIDFRFPEAALPEDLRMDFSFDVVLSETNVGQIGNANGKFHATIDADVLPGATNPLGGIEIWGAALLTTNFEFLQTVGLFASASGLLRINSSATDKPAEVLRDVHGNMVTIALPAQSFALRLDGSVDFRIDFNGNGSYALSESAFLIEGTFVLEFSAEQGFNVAIFDEATGGGLAPATLLLGPTGHRLLTFEVFGFLAVRNDGFAANLALSADATLPLGLASIEATAVLIVNTTGRDVFFTIPGGAADPNRPTGLSLTIPRAGPTNPSAVLQALNLQQLINGQAWSVAPSAPGSPYGVVFLKGSLELLSVLDLDVSGFVLLSANVVSLEVNFSAAGSFLGLASASASGSLFFSSEGEFEVDVHGNVQLGPDWINIRGGADLTISFLDNNGKASGGNLIMALDVDGSLSVGATVFGVNLGDLTLGVSYRSSTGNITVSVPYLEPFFDSSCWDTFLGEICVYYPNVRTNHFPISVGTLTAQATEPPPPPVLGQVNGGVLTLNVGADAGARNLLIDEIDEIVVIDRVGNAIQVSMFGHSQAFSGVTSILIADMGAGNDFVDIRPGVATPLEVHFGAGLDRLRNSGSGGVVAFGDDGNDRLEGGSAHDLLFGGSGDDLIDGGAGDDWIEGGDDGDTLFGGEGDDTILGGRGNDLIAGDRAVVEGSATSAVVRTIASAAGGSDVILGGDGVDIIFGGSGGDAITGGAGGDSLFGDDGTVTILVNQPQSLPVAAAVNLGFSGNDSFGWLVGDGDDVVDGQIGSDTLDIVGTDGGAEEVTLGAKGAGFTVDIGAAELSVDGVEISNIEGRRGGDTFTVNDLGASALLLVNIKLGGDSVQDAVVINGSSSGDGFTIATPGDVFRVQKTGGVTVDIFGADIASGGDTLTLNAAGGADIVNVLGTRAGTFTTVNAGSGDDTINVGSSAPAAGGTVDGIDAPLFADGGDDVDTLNVDDTGDAAPDTGMLTATALSGLGMAATISYGRLESLNIGLGSGADSFTIMSTHAGTTVLSAGAGDDTVDVQTIGGATTVHAGSGSDAINVGSSGTLDGIAALLTVNGNEPASGSDILNVDDSGDTGPNTGALTATAITGLGMGGGIAYGTIEMLNIELGSGADSFTIEGTHGGTTRLDTNAGDDMVNVRAISGDTTVDGGIDDDTVNIGSLAPAAGGTLEGIAALLTIEGSEPASGSDVLNVDDSGDTGANTGALTAGTITGLGMTGAIAYGTVETLNIDLGSGGDTFTIESTHAGETHLHANGGADTVNVQSVAGESSVDGGSGDDTINVGGAAPAAGGTLDGLAAPLTVSGGDGVDMLNVDDTGDTESDSGALTATAILGLGMTGGIGYLDFETLVISLGSGGNHFAITGTMRRDDAATMTIVNTGAGDDVVTVSLDAATDGPLVVNLQEGDNSLDASGSSLDLVISGGGGSDAIAGGSGADNISGGGGDDVLVGGLGNDALYGEDGNDILIGDVGEVVGGHVLLTHVASLVGALALNGPEAPGADQAVLDALFDADLMLLAGRYLPDGSKALNADGSWDSRALLLELVADGDDTLAGGEGDDALFGQRGNDSLTGGNGDDLLSGGAGDDELAGGEGNDTLVGDDVHLDSATATFPNVRHGLLLDGAAIVPMASVEPGRDTNAPASVLAHVFENMPDNSVALADGSVLVPFASVVTDFAHHLGQLRGNDRLWGEGGDDTLVGDDQMVYARAVSFDAGSMARAEAITRALLDVSDDFSDLVHRQYGLLEHDHHRVDDHRTVVDNVFTVGADLLYGGEGNDVLIGDDNLLMQPSFTLPAGLAGDFERFAEGVTDGGDELVHAVLDLGDLAHHQRAATVLEPHRNHVHEVLEHHVDVVAMGNDTIFGGNGNDLIVGDAFIVRTADVTLLADGSAWYFGKDDAWQDDDWKDRRGLDDLGWKHGHHHDHDDDHDDDRRSTSIKVGADVISGGDGADLIWGDNLALIGSTVTRGAGLGWKAFDEAKDEVEDGLEALVQLTDGAALWLAPQAGDHHHHHHHDGGRGGLDNGDHISGGEGDDILFGQGGDDTLCGDAGSDWLVGGDGKDRLDGGPGKDKLQGGSDSSSGLRSAIASRTIDWSDSFGNYGLTYAPFGGLTLAKGGGQQNLSSFAFVSDRARGGHDDD